MSELDAIKEILDSAGMATGNESRTYTLPERVQHLVTIKDYFVRQTDITRAAITKAEAKERIR